PNMNSEKIEVVLSMSEKFMSSAIFVSVSILMFCLIRFIYLLIIGGIVKNNPATTFQLMDLSIVIPLLNEEESLQELHDWIVSVMQSGNFTYELIFIDDGSTDNSWRVISGLAEGNPNVRAIHFHKNYGKSQALHAGFARAQ